MAISFSQKAGAALIALAALSAKGCDSEDVDFSARDIISREPITPTFRLFLSEQEQKEDEYPRFSQALGRQVSDKVAPS